MLQANQIVAPNDYSTSPNVHFAKAEDELGYKKLGVTPQNVG
ncbi:Uncharacterised protein [Vibrio cholerae]|nr:Uncharacterised protein [Vibrio cholerae]